MCFRLRSHNGTDTPAACAQRLGVKLPIQTAFRDPDAWHIQQHAQMTCDPKAARMRLPLPVH